MAELVSKELRDILTKQLSSVDISEQGHVKVRYSRWAKSAYIYYRRLSEIDSEGGDSGRVGIQDGTGSFGWAGGISYYSIEDDSELEHITKVTHLTKDEVTMFVVLAEFILKQHDWLHSVIHEFHQKEMSLEEDRRRLKGEVEKRENELGILARLRGYSKRLGVDVSDVIDSYIRVREADKAVEKTLQEVTR